MDTNPLQFWGSGQQTPAKPFLKSCPPVSITSPASSHDLYESVYKGGTRQTLSTYCNIFDI